MSVSMWLIALVLEAGAVKANGTPETVTFERETAYVVGASGVTLEASGPGMLVFEIRGDATGPVAFEIVRDAQTQAKATLALKPTPKGKAPYARLARAGVELAEGAHTLVLRADAKVAVVAKLQKKLPAGVTALAFVDGAATPATASAAPSPTSATSSATAAPAGRASAPPAANASAARDAEAADLAAGMAETRAAIAAQAPAGAAAPRASRVGAGAAAPALRVAVYDFDLSGVDINTGAVVTDSLLAEIRKLAGVSAIGMDEIRAMLSHEANKQYMGCEESESCLAEIAGALGVDELVSGKLAKVDSGFAFIVRRIDQQHARVVGSVNQRLAAGSGEEFLAAIGPAVEQLFADRQLREGATRGVPKEMALRLNPPPLPQWVFWSGAAATVVVGAAGGVFGLLMKGAESRYQDQVTTARTQLIEGATLVSIGNEATRNKNLANYSFAGAASLALTSGIIALFTDWHGYREAAAATAAPR